MKKYVPILVCLLFITSSCNQCKTSVGPTELKNITFVRSDGRKFSFDVVFANRIFASAKDNENGLEIVTTQAIAANLGVNPPNNYITSYILLHGLDTLSRVVLSFNNNLNNDPNGPLTTRMESYTKDTTVELGNLSNIGYTLPAGVVYDPKTKDTLGYYLRQPGWAMKDSFRTAIPGVYDTSERMVYTFDINKQHSGDHYYSYPDDLSIWIIECAIKFSHSRFTDLKSRREQFLGVAITGETYYNDNAVSATYTYNYSIDKSNYTVGSKIITDKDGKVSTVVYRY